MPKSSRRRSRKHDGYREEEEERERSDSDEGSRRRGQEEEEKRRPARVSKGSEQQEKRPSSASAKLTDAGGEASGLSVEGHRKRKGREERESFTGDDRWSGGGGGEGDGLCYYDSKKSRNSGGDVKGRSAGRSDEVARRKSEKEVLLEDDSAGENHRTKEGARDHGSAKLKESSKEAALKEGGMVRAEDQYKTANDRSREHREENRKESRHDTSLKVMSRNKEVKSYDPEGDKARNKCNGTDGHQFPDELHDDSSKDRQTLPGDVNNIINGCYEQQHRDEKFKHEMSTVVEKRREGNHKDGRRKAEDRHKDNKYEDGRHREETRYRDERYEEEKSRITYRNRDSKYKEDRSKNERYKEKSRDEEKSRNVRYDDNSREKYQDDIHRNHRYKDGRSWNARSSRDNTRDRSLEKHYKEEHSYSDSRDSRYSKNRIRDNEGNQPSAEHRSSKYRDDSKGKKRSYEENIDDGDLQPRNAKDHHRDYAKRRAEVGSFVSSADRRREHVMQEKDDKVDTRRKSPITSRHFIKQEESSPRGCSAASGLHKQIYDVQSVDGQNKTDANVNESSFSSKDDRSLRYDGQSTHFTDRSPSAGQQVLFQNNMRHTYDNDDLLRKGKHCEVPSNRQSTENHQSTSPGHLPPPPDRFEMDSHRSFNDDNRSQIRERRSSSRSRRSGTVDNVRGHSNAWNNHLSWPSPVSNGFGPVQCGPPLPGFHPAVHQFPPQSAFGLRPSMDINHSRVLYPLLEHPEGFSHHAQPFPWHNPAENSWPFLPQLPGWDANRNALEEYSHSYDKQELGSNENFDLQQKTKVSFSAHDTIDGSLQLSGQNQSGQSKAEISNIKTVDEAIGEKTDMEAPKYKSEKKLGPNIKADNSQFCSKYFKRLDISTSLSSPELYKKCIAVAGKLNPAVSSKSTIMHPCLKNNKDESHCQSKSSRHMIKSIFSGKAFVFENAMALYRSNIGYMKPKFPASSVHPESEKVTERAPENTVNEDTVAAPEDQGMPHITTGDDVHNNDHPHDGVVLNMAVESGFVSKEDGKGDSNTGEKSPRINYDEVHVCDTEEHQVPSNNKGELPHDARSSQPACCNAVNLAEVADEQVSGVISDSAFAPTSQACEDVMPGCRVNLSRIPCPPGST